MLIESIACLRPMCRVILYTQTRPQAQHFLSPLRRAEAMVISKAKAAPEDAPTTVSTSTTTPPIVLEAADAPASMCEHMVVGKRAGTATKGQTESAGICRVQ